MDGALQNTADTFVFFIFPAKFHFPLKTAKNQAQKNPH
jgi:hypothetical protein